jgi:hypothetical protein
MGWHTVPPYGYRRGPTDSPTPERHPLAKQVEIGEMLEDMQPPGVIGASPSPWSSPILVRKNGDLQFHMDNRKLNNITKKDCFPLPRIDDTLHTL